MYSISDSRSNSQLNGINSLLIISIITLGATSIVTQIVLMREFLSVFGGNELIIGIILANWLTLTGIGAFLGKHSRKISNKIILATYGLVLIAVLPVIAVFMLNYLRSLVYPFGTTIGLVSIFNSSLILLLPYCLVSGFLFTLFACAISDIAKSNVIAKVYSWESIGSMIGGLLFSLIAVYILSSFQSLFILMMINLVIAVRIAFVQNKRLMGYIIVLIIAFSLVVTYFFNVYEIVKKFVFKDQELLYYKDTPYGSLAITKLGSQKNFYENGILLFATEDPSSNEEAVHYAMVQHPNPKNVLLISGGISGTISEILKYEIDRIDYVEINPWIIEIGIRYATLPTDKRINVISEDARLFIKKTSCRYDIVLINLPNPSTAQLNRFFTVEFFEELKQKLNCGGVVSLSLLPFVEYYGSEARQINSIMYNTLKIPFKKVLIVPGMKNYFLASDGFLNIDIVKLLEQKGIENVYVNKYYVDSTILRQRSQEMASLIQVDTKLNEDFYPLAYYQQLTFWLKQFGLTHWFVFGIVIIVLLFVFLRLNTISLGVFTGGFAASSLEVLIIISFQVIYGYIYHALGIIITVFMAGLAIGSLYCYKIFRKPSIYNFAFIQFSIAILALVLPFFLIIIKSNISFLVQVVFYSITLAISIVVGIEFALATKLGKGAVETISSEIYGVDLLGSAIGSLVVSAYLLPLFGIVKVCLVITLLNLASGLVSFLSRKKFEALI